VHTRYLEIEWNHRHRREEKLDKSLCAGPSHSAFEAVDAVEQVGRCDRRHRDLVLVVFVPERRWIEPSSLDRDEDARVD